jgi:putative ATP-dependent endonuclease of OLD family
VLKKLKVQNYRSINSAEIDLSAINALIGANNSGKSNLMKALNLLLGGTYPSVRSFDDRDFHQYNKTNPIVLQIMFDTPLAINVDVWGFRLTFDGNDCAYVATDQNGGPLTYRSGTEIRVSNDMRDEVALMYLGLDREASDQVKSTQWTLYGKLLRYIEKQIDAVKKDTFKQEIQNAYNSHISADLQQLENLLKAYVKEQTGLNLHLKMRLVDPLETIKNLRPYLSEGASTLEFDAEDMGAGTQSALAVAIARAYGDIVRKPLVLAIEEPELYLHPHGCRNFYKILKTLPQSNVQVIYTSHDRCFVDMADFTSIRLIRKEGAGTRVHSGVNAPGTLLTQVSTTAKFDEEVNEVFFANHVILVEASPDKIACSVALSTLGLDLDKECVSVIDCCGNRNIEPIAKVLRIFNIPAYALVDEDPGNTATASTIASLKALLGNGNVFLQAPRLEEMFGLHQKPSKADAIDFFPSWFSGNVPQAVYTSLKTKICP